MLTIIKSHVVHNSGLAKFEKLKIEVFREPIFVKLNLHCTVENWCNGLIWMKFLVNNVL